MTGPMLGSCGKKRLTPVVYQNSEIAKTFTSFTFCPSGLPCYARSRPPASRFTSFRSAVVELTILLEIADALSIGIARLTKVSRCSTFALRVTPGGVISKSPKFTAFKWRFSRTHFVSSHLACYPE